MPRKYFSGNAVTTTLNGNINDSTLTIVIDDATGWPTTGPFVAAISYGETGEEKVLVESTTVGTTTTLTIQSGGRGYDDTTAASHLNGATVAHVLDAGTIDEANQHVNDPQLDHHTNYLTEERHDLISRHTFGAALGTPAAPADIGTTADAGGGAIPARWDHVHVIGAGAINNTDFFTEGVVAQTSIATTVVWNTAQLATDAVTTVQMGAGAIDSVRPFDVYHRPVIISTSAPVHSSPDYILTEGDIWFNPNTSRYAGLDGSTWRWIAGHPYYTLLENTTSHNFPDGEWRQIGPDWTETVNLGITHVAGADPSGILEAPVTGIYEIGAYVGWGLIGADASVRLRVGIWIGDPYVADTAATIQLGSGSPFGSSDQTMGGSIVYPLTAADRVRIVVKYDDPGGTEPDEDLVTARFWMRLISETWA